MDERGEVLQMQREGSPTTGLPTQGSGCGGDAGQSDGSEPDSGGVGKLECPKEPVAPADKVKVDRPLTCNYNSENVLIVSVITPYQLIRHLTAPITLAESIKSTAMVNSGAMGNFIHPRFIKEHALVTKERNLLTVNDVNG